MLKRIFVTGGNGFIGSRVLHHLLKNGYLVRALLRKTSSTHRIDTLPIETCYGDILDEDSLVQGMQGCQAVIHLACLSNWNDIHSAKMPKVVIEGSKNLFQAAKKLGNLKVVYVSSSTAMHGTEEPIVQDERVPFRLDKRRYVYGWAKHEVEKICRALVSEGQSITIVNPAEVYGPQDDQQVTCGNLRDFARSNPVFVCSGGTSIVHVDDVAEGIVAALDKGRAGERYFLGGDNLTVKELAELTLHLLGKSKKVLTVNNQLLLFLAKIGKLFPALLPFNPHVIPYATKYWFFNNRKAKEELGVSFRPAKEILQETLSWMKQKEII